MDAVDRFAAELRDTAGVDRAPAPSAELLAVFADGMGDRAPVPVPAPRRVARPRRRLAAALGGGAAALALAGGGAAGALPGPAQSAYDWTADAVGLDRRPSTTPADDVDVADVPATTPAPAGTDDGRRFAGETVVPDATDDTSPGIDEPTEVSGEARELGDDAPGESEAPQGGVADDPPAPVDPATPPGGGTTAEGERPEPPDEAADPDDEASPYRSGGTGEMADPPSGGRP